jgi:hypothetical protein
MTNREWARLFRAVESVGGLVAVDSDDWYDAEVEKVGRVQVTLKQTYDTGSDMNPLVDRFETFRYDELNGVRFDVSQWDGTPLTGKGE